MRVSSLAPIKCRERFFDLARINKAPVAIEAGERIDTVSNVAEDSNTADLA